MRAFMAGWARIAALGGWQILPEDAGDDPVDLALIAGPVPGLCRTATRCFILDDGSPAPVLRDRLEQAGAEAVLCLVPDRMAAPTGQRARRVTPAVELWRWTRPVRPFWPKGRLVVASDAAAGRLGGAASLPLPEAGADFAPAVQAVVLQRTEGQLFHALAALATGLPLVLPEGGLPWLGPEAALRVPVDEAAAELIRLASDPGAWFDQVRHGLAAAARLAHPAGLLADLDALAPPVPAHPAR